MRISISVERLRVWLLVGAGLLVMVITAFLGYAHYRAHRFLTELPGKLGIDVTRETNAFTYSQSLGGRTVYTIHAAKAVQHKDGKYTLHDVGIVVYGRTSDRADRIYGSEFEYDQKAGVARAMGEVHLDLEAPAPVDAQAKREYAAGAEPGGEHDARMIHVKTSGLVFMQKAGTAATDREIEFEFHGMTGHAMGADYNSSTGIVVLHSAVNVVGVQQGKPVSLTASRAELDRPNRRVVLSQAKYTVAGDTRTGAGESAQAQRAVVHLRENGSAERLEAMGAVTLTNGDGSRVVAPKGDLLLDAENTPQSAMLAGGVRYMADEPLRQAQGEAAEGRAAFNSAGKLKHLTLTGAVKLHERARASGTANEAWSKRDLTAGAVELAFSSDKAGKAQLQDAKATENARLTLVSSAGKTRNGETVSDLEADVLTAHLTSVNGVQRLAVVNGTGHTLLRRASADGAVNTSSGDTLEVHFRAVNTHAGRTTDEISTAVQEGNVVITQRSAKKSKGAPQEQRATAARAVYNGATQQLMLTGNVQLTDAESMLWADDVSIAQKTGNAEADGAVKASYKLSGNGNEPVHVTAARAMLKHDAGQAIFYGAEGRPARLWQGASQVEAPVLQFEQKEKRLLAHDDRQGASMDVHTVLVNGGSGKAGAKKTQVVRVSSGKLTYSDAIREAEFTEGVQVENADGRMKGQEAVVYLPPKGTAAQGSGGTQNTSSSEIKVAGQGGFMGGKVERVVATGHIEIDQPGRRATGERVVYTASDGLFVMTGTATALPKIVDEARGTITGTSLRFHAGDENVVVSNGVDSKQRVRTETRVKKER
jgi:lipopolysaccharide export system protein LptA